MQERNRNKQNERAGSPGSGIFDNDPLAPADPAMAAVAYGPYSEELPIAGMTVGAARQRLQARFDIDPGAVAYVGGNEADEQTTIRAGETLTFVRRAGEKGAEPRERIVFEGPVVRAEMLEGESIELPLPDLLRRVTPPRPDTGELIVPDGVKSVVPTRGGLVAVVQVPPSVRSLSWIAEDSPAASGMGAKYRPVRIALPYVIIIARFTRDGENPGHFCLTTGNELYFRNKRLESLDDKLLYPALLNCARMENPRRPLSWVCCQHVPTDSHPGIAFGVGALVSAIFSSAFNRDFEARASASWFTETVSAHVDPRLTSIESWEAATEADPLFAVDVQWLQSGKTVREVVERGIHRQPRIECARDIARVMFHAREAQSPSSRRRAV
ncbi:MAG: hypothetical protein ACYTGZ_06830 [Planctomycetota bacterium]|jgi:hypothetical protein